MDMEMGVVSAVLTAAVAVAGGAAARFAGLKRDSKLVSVS